MSDRDKMFRVMQLECSMGSIRNVSFAYHFVFHFIYTAHTSYYAKKRSLQSYTRSHLLALEDGIVSKM